MNSIDDRLFFFRISRMHRLYAKALIKRLDPHGVKPGYLDILTKLWEQDNITQKQLHERMELEQATLSNSLKRMERDSIVERKRNPRDRRMTYIVLTPRGRSLQKVIHTAVDDLQNVANTGLTVNDKRYFHRILKQMSKQIENDLNDPTLILIDEVEESVE